jgi:pyruvate/2-oxoglutarate dehydrogenase complex dihydrolipoamide acyltransferase (E2) component
LIYELAQKYLLKFRNLINFLQNLIELANKGKTGKITTDDMAGGTFTISNGKIYLIMRVNIFLKLNKKINIKQFFL